MLLWWLGVALGCFFNRPAQRSLTVQGVERLSLAPSHLRSLSRPFSVVSEGCGVTGCGVTVVDVVVTGRRRRGRKQRGKSKVPVKCLACPEILTTSSLRVH